MIRDGCDSIATNQPDRADENPSSFRFSIVEHDPFRPMRRAGVKGRHGSFRAY
jgi:hypothetical protein